MNTAQASRLVFEHLLKGELHCEGMGDNFRKAANGASCVHGQRVAHEVQIPDMERDVWFIYKTEIAFMELPNAHIKVYRHNENFVVSITSTEGSGIGIERTVLKAKLIAFANYIYNGFTNEQITQFKKENNDT